MCQKCIIGEKRCRKLYFARPCTPLLFLHTKLQSCIFGNWTPAPILDVFHPHCLSYLFDDKLATDPGLTRLDKLRSPRVWSTKWCRHCLKRHPHVELINCRIFSAVIACPSVSTRATSSCEVQWRTSFVIFALWSVGYPKSLKNDWPSHHFAYI